MYNGVKALLFTGSIPRGVFVCILRENSELNCATVSGPSANGWPEQGEEKKDWEFDGI